MECNKEEAVRAKEIAEKKFLANDIGGAKKFALKAQNLYPGLEDVTRMLATFEVYIFAENKLNGEADWYGVLGVNPGDDYETLKRNYRKQALILHPDKNRSVGADGAFKYISEAWSLLSDKAKRAAFDLRTKAHRKTSSYGVPSATPAKNVNSRNTKTSSEANVKTEKNSSSNAQRARHRATSGSSSKPRPETIWIQCRRCMMQCEFVGAYSNSNLRCHNCNVELSPPVRPVRNCTQQNRNPTENPASENMQSSGGNKRAFDDSCSESNWEFSRTASAVRAAFVVQQAYEKVKKARKEAQAKAKKAEAALHRKNSKRTSNDSSRGSAAKRRKFSEDNKTTTCETKPISQTGNGVGNLDEIKNRAFEAGRCSKTAAKNGMGKGFSQLDIRSFLIKKVKNEPNKKPGESPSAAAAENAAK